MADFKKNFSRGRGADRNRSRPSVRDSGDFRRGNFDRRDSGNFRNDRRDSADSRSERQMYTGTCDKCGERCELPFRPTSSKPVYCHTCFRKNDDSGPSRSSSSNDFKKDFAEINAKLDKIIEALDLD